VTRATASTIGTRSPKVIPAPGAGKAGTSAP
jgi:hypothetical protein